MFFRIEIISNQYILWMFQRGSILQLFRISYKQINICVKACQERNLSRIWTAVLGEFYGDSSDFRCFPYIFLALSESHPGADDLHFVRRIISAQLACLCFLKAITNQGLRRVPGFLRIFLVRCKTYRTRRLYSVFSYLFRFQSDAHKFSRNALSELTIRFSLRIFAFVMIFWMRRI